MNNDIRKVDDKHLTNFLSFSNKTKPTSLYGKGFDARSQNRVGLKYMNSRAPEQFDGCFKDSIDVGINYIYDPRINHSRDGSNMLRFLNDD